ncbi:MAG: heme ABC transporter ATP-binding protein [Actinobacteria bacterium]|nr:MAG: heme ABC transporter ATP-binding protein [Actinomycetota bacterium]
MTVVTDGAGVSLELNGIVKRFGDLTAVSSFDISFAPGQVHALLGENGAGKSTLMNVAAGFLTPDVGEIAVGGQQVRFGSPKDAIDAGIGMVHQHFSLVEQFTVAQNLAIGARDIGRLTSTKELNTRALEIGERYGLKVSPSKVVGSLSVGEKQRVEILRTLSRGARVLILDEPTAVLTPEESEQLCVNLRSMAGAGATIIFISHKLNEVLSVADHVSVMRGGALVDSLERRECNLQSLAKSMFDDFGTADERPRTQSATSIGEEVLVVRGIQARDERGAVALKGLSLSVHAHEIVGLVGVAGNGQQELEQIVAGIRKPDSGTVSIHGTQVGNVQDALKAGLGYIPEDRRGTGLVPAQPIWLNSILRIYKDNLVSKGLIIKTGKAKKYARDLAESVNLSTNDVTTLVQHLSGGNAQKLLAGRELSGDKSAVVAVNPTQGLDVKAAAAVRERLIQAREDGFAVLLISADLDEVVLLSDRIVVLYEGSVVGEFAAEDADLDEIGRLMGGETSNGNS